ncbi:hypothetical protein EJ08DRAFT_691901 [Tothia fuscella]|uniref:Uncharacterized protein n=1 Tax=Tothia fuscella TaxID=1048955 RepID=A0A9P4P2D7_9PEZI|nr:hypothetical protein EJ08DRAFT_691901 [Tothia fuscella]
MLSLYLLSAFLTALITAVSDAATGPIAVPVITPHTENSLTLYPAVHWTKDTVDLRNLDPAWENRLYYTNSGLQTSPQVQHVFSDINTTFAFQAVVLEYSTYIQNVRCTPEGLEVVFADSRSFHYAARSWTSFQEIAFITNANRCNASCPGQLTYWLSTAIWCDEFGLVIHIVNKALIISEVYREVTMSWGTWVPSRPHSVLQTCGFPPNSEISGLSTAPCGPQFDKFLDEAIGYIHNVPVADFVAIFCPGLKSEPGNSLSKRGILELFQPGIAAIESVVQEGLDAVTANLKSKVLAAESIPIVPVPSINFDVPINIVPPFLDESPFGNNSFLLFEEEYEYDDIEPKIALFCVDCSVQGDIHVSGAASFSVWPPRLHSGTLSMNGSLSTTLSLGIVASVAREKILTKAIGSIGVPALSIPNFFTVGPFVTLEGEFAIRIEAGAAVQAGAIVETPSFLATLDLVDTSRSNYFGVDPQLTPILSIQSSVEGSISFAMPLNIGFGIAIEAIGFHKSIALVERPSITASLTLTKYVSLLGTPNDSIECPNGISAGLNFENEISVNVLDQKEFQLLTKTLPILTPFCFPSSNKIRRLLRDTTFLESFSGAQGSWGYAQVHGAALPPCLPSYTPITSSLSPSTRCRSVVNISSTTPTTDTPTLPTVSPSDVETFMFVPINDSSGNYSLTISSKGTCLAIRHDTQATQFSALNNGAVVVGDASENPLYYYNSTMDKYGVSRLRSADVNHLPWTSRLVFLVALDVPVTNGSSPNGLYLALDTQGNWFFPIVCQYTDGQGLDSTVYIVKDIDQGKNMLESPEVRYTVTGGIVKQCTFVSWMSIGKGVR